MDRRLMPFTLSRPARRRLAWGAGAVMLGGFVAVFAGPFGPAPAPDPARIVNAPTPSLWLSDLAAPAARGFASLGYRDPVMRHVDPAPVVAERVVRDAAVPPLALAPEPRAPLDTPAETRALTPALTPAPVAVAAVDESRSQPVTRSPMPRARPALSDPTEQAPVVLARSLVPAARPEGVARLATIVLASLDLPIDTGPAPGISQTVAPAPSPAPSVAPAPAIAVAGNPCGRARAIPRRSGSAPAGSDIASSLAQVSGRARDDALVQQVLAGNIPDHLRGLVPVTFDATVSGRPTRVTLCVMPDYLAVGSDRDHVRIPLGMPAALRVAAALDMALPTRRIVDAIYAQADVRLAPAPMEPTAQMSTTAYFVRHNATIEQQRRAAGAGAGVLVAGHKKDVVISTRLESAPGRVAIYGWHRANGRAIQPLSTVHGAQYADYSHGIRLISRTAYVNGRAVDLAQVLGDASLAGMISDEGPIRNSRLLAGL